MKRRAGIPSRMDGVYRYINSRGPERKHKHKGSVKARRSVSVHSAVMRRSVGCDNYGRSSRSSGGQELELDLLMHGRRRVVGL